MGGEWLGAEIHSLDQVHLMGRLPFDLQFSKNEMLKPIL
jgi:hypothetical protein